MTTIASQITSLTVVYSTVYSDADQRKHQSSASLAFVWGIHRDRWIPRTKDQLRGKCFHLMTSSCKHKGPYSYFMKSPQSNTRIKFHHDVICFSIYSVRSNSSRKHFSPGRQTFDNVLALFVLLTTCLFIYDFGSLMSYKPLNTRLCYIWENVHKRPLMAGNKISSLPHSCYFSAYLLIIAMYNFLWDVITHTCPNFNGVLTKPRLK